MRTASREDAGLLPPETDVHPVEVPAQHTVHRDRHVLLHSAREDGDLRVGVRRDRPCDLVERIQALGQPQQHDARAPDPVGIERAAAVTGVEAEAMRVGCERTFGDDRVLVHPDAGAPVALRRRIRAAHQFGRRECQAAVRVAHDGHVRRSDGEKRGCRGIEDEPLCGIRRGKIVRFRIGPAAKAPPLELDHGISLGGAGRRLRAVSAEPPLCCRARTGLARKRGWLGSRGVARRVTPGRPPSDRALEGSDAVVGAAVVVRQTIARAVQLVAERALCVVRGIGTPLLQHGDHVLHDVLERAGRHDVGEVETIHVGFLGPVLEQVGDRLAAAGIEYGRTPVYKPFRAGDVRHSQADVSKAQCDLGYVPLIDLRTGMEDALPWYLGFIAGEKGAAFER